MKKLRNILQTIMNDYSIKKKLLVLYICCVLIPLFLTDSVILYIVFSNEKVQQEQEFESIASAVEADLTSTFDEAISLTNNLYINRTINEFLETKFASPLDFFEESRKITTNPFSSSMNSDRFQVAFYADNDTIVNGGYFYRLSSLMDSTLARAYGQVDKPMALIFYYKEDAVNVVSNRKICLVRKLDHYSEMPSEKYVCVNIDYPILVRHFQEMRYNAPVMICSEDRILFTNDKTYTSKLDYSYLDGTEDICLEREFTICGEPFRILITQPETGLFTAMMGHIPLIFCLLLVNICLPMILVYMINRSFAVRLGMLSEAFDRTDTEELTELEHIEGKDEIAALMLNYNRMVHRLQELIRTVYKDRLEKQEIDLAKQQAELLALHSQIDPHTMFNMLESIRMHSVLKDELETAGMVERLAVLTRQRVNWSADQITIVQETEYIRQYLELQKYRFGERLSYEITVSEEVRNYLIPKLTLVTFVENSCIHGVEKKAVPCWIYLRVYEKEQCLIMEVEDTGGGMDEDEVADLNVRMNQVVIEDIKHKKHVGVLNACLRLKLATQNRVSFEMEGEKGIGTFLVIRIPLEVLQPEEQDG